MSKGTMCLFSRVTSFCLNFMKKKGVLSAVILAWFYTNNGCSMKVMFNNNNNSNNK